MSMTLTEKIIHAHLVSGTMEAGEEIALKIDQTLTQDATGTMAYLQFEAMDIPRVRTEKSVAYIDHNMLQSGFENADDHRYIQSVCEKYGIYYSAPGNGICHQVHLERFAVPGRTLIGSDSHTPTCGGMGMLAIGAGGLDVAVAMGGGAYYIPMPRVVGIHLTGQLTGWASAKDVILHLLGRLTVKGAVGAVMEYGGEGVATLSIPERATIANMGAELGATASIFPADAVTEAFLTAQARAGDYTAHCADPDAVYDRVIEISLSDIVPMAACPHSPDNVKTVAELTGLRVDQVCIGSCTNSSLRDLVTVAALFRGKTLSSKTDTAIAPGSRQVLSMLADQGALSDLLQAGARVLECGCGPCIGMGFSPPSGGVSLRTFNRNFIGRSGTADADVYLVSPQTAAMAALHGCITDPATWGTHPLPILPASFIINDNAVYPPAPVADAASLAVVRGPNIRPVPAGQPLSDTLDLPVLLTVGDHITTDHIMPAGSKILPYRSNIPHLSRYCFAACDADFPQRALSLGGGCIVAGDNYGQGSSREHAALVPLYLGVRVVIAAAFSRIHRANLINAGIVPLTFYDPSQKEWLTVGEPLRLSGLHGSEVTATRLSDGTTFALKADFTPRQAAILKAGGLLRYTKEGAQ